MEYEIQGGNLPVVKIRLMPGESVRCESGAMSWMDEEIRMDTESRGAPKALGRLLTGEKLFLNTYSTQTEGELVLASKFPGSILAVPLAGGGIICQKGTFLACTGEIESHVYMQKKLRNGFFGGEGFFLREYVGDGTVFLEIDGSANEYNLADGECKVISSGYLAAMESTCRMEIQTVKGLKNVAFGGEGLFHTAVYGPGKVILQSMPINRMAMVLYNHMPHTGD